MAARAHPGDVALYVPGVVSDAGEAPQLPRDGKGTWRRMSWHACSLADRTPPSPEIRGPLQHRPGLIRPGQRWRGGDQRVDSACGQGLMGLPISGSCPRIPRPRSCPLGIPTNQGFCGGSAQRCGRALARLKTRAVGGRRYRTRAGADDPQDGQRTSPLCQGHTGQAAGVDPAVDRGGPVGCPDTLVGGGLGERRDRVTHNAITTLHTMHEVAKAPHPYRSCSASMYWRRSQRQNRACRCDAGAGDRAPQGREGRRVWPGRICSVVSGVGMSLGR